MAGAASVAESVTLSRGEFDMICRKLNNLETSLAELRQEVWRNAQGRANENHDPSLASLADGAREVSSDGNSDGMQQFRRHTEIHGIHTSNEAVSSIYCPPQQAAKPR